MESIDEKLASEEYEQLVEKGLAHLHAKCESEPNRNEAVSRRFFQEEFHHLARVHFGKNIPLQEEEKIHRDVFSGKHFKGKGSMDAICHQLVIEYKKPKQLSTPALRKKATVQLHEYLESLYKDDGSKYTGLLTDASLLQFSHWEDEELVTTDFGRITKNDFKNIMRHLLGTESKSFNTRNIVNDFRIGSDNDISSNLSRLLFSKLKQAKNSDQAHMLWLEWLKHSHYSLDDNGKAADVELRRKALGDIMKTTIKSPKTDYMALFALQTTYAIIVKLIACRVLTKLEHDGDMIYFQDLIELDSNQLQKRLNHMETGAAISGIQNLLEGDFFSWYCLDEVWDEQSSQCVVPLIRELGLYTPESYMWNSRTLDIFEALYMGMMPTSVRHSNGEYFTPSWLANQVIERSIEVGELDDDFTAIDPCCGSGVFLMQLIKKFIGNQDIAKLTQTERGALFDKLVNCVVGIDINPLSVLAARVNFFLSTRELLVDYQGTIEIPIYLGDSTYFAPLKEVGGTTCYVHQMSTKEVDFEVVLPSCLVDGEDFFQRISSAQIAIKGGIDAEKNADVLLEGYEDLISNDVKDKVVDLLNRLGGFQQKGLGTLWIRIIANYMRCASIDSRDLIVGNPPWVRWSNLQQKYNEKITREINDTLSHIFSGDAWMGGIQLNICALIANRTASRWLTNHGLLAFLMPKSVAQHHSYNGFRNFIIDAESGTRLYLQELDDWEKAGNPFHGTDATEKFMTYFFNRNAVDYNVDGVPVNRYLKLKGKVPPSGDLTYESVRHLYQKEEGTRAHVVRKSDTAFTYFSEDGVYSTGDFAKIIGPTHYHWGRTGVEFTPSDIFLFESAGKSRNEDRWKFTPTKGIKGIRNIDYGPVELEKALIKSVVRGPDVSPFQITDKKKQFGLVPFADGKSKPYNQGELTSIGPHAYAYLTQRREIIESQSDASLALRRGEAQRGGEHFYSLGKIGVYTTAPHIVVYRDNGNYAAAVMGKRPLPWGGEARPVTEKHAAIIAETNNCFFHETSGEMLMSKKELKRLPKDQQQAYHQQAVRNITEDESYYICGILNAPIVNAYFLLSADPRGISKVNVVGSIKMPLYNSKDKDHLELVGISKKATQQGFATEEQLKDLDAAYRRIVS